MTDFLFDGPDDARLTVALAHGAGAPMDSLFMASVATGLAARAYRVARFEFPYMTKLSREGVRRPPDRLPVLFETWRQVISQLGPEQLVIGGKSMGGRIASLVADEAGVRGLVCLGYPFHPAGRPENLRVEHLAALRTPTLICQGERDALGNRAEVGTYQLSPAINLHWLTDGDHSFKPRRTSGCTEQQNLDDAVKALIVFLDSL